MKHLLKEVARGKKGARDLTYEQAREVADAFISNEATDAQKGAYLVAQRLKTETADEVRAFINTYQSFTSRVKLPEELQHKVIDLAGPYNGRSTFAATIPSAYLLADSGFPIYLHSSDSLPPKYGVSLKAIMDEVGINVRGSAQSIAESIAESSLGFGWTEKLCPPLAQMRTVREQIGVRTFYNVVEKLLNVTQASTVFVGVFHKTVIDQHIQLLRDLGYEKGFILQGVEGSEDLPIHRKSLIYIVTQDDVEQVQVDPADYGLKHRKESSRESLSLMQQVDIITRIIEGDDSDHLAYYRDQVLLNTGVRYYLLGHTSSIEAGIELANEQLQGKRAYDRFQQWQQSSSNRKETVS